MRTCFKAAYRRINQKPFFIFQSEYSAIKKQMTENVTQVEPVRIDRACDLHTNQEIAYVTKSNKLTCSWFDIQGLESVASHQPCISFPPFSLQLRQLESTFYFNIRPEEPLHGYIFIVNQGKPSAQHTFVSKINPICWCSFLLFLTKCNTQAHQRFFINILERKASQKGS